MSAVVASSLRDVMDGVAAEPWWETSREIGGRGTGDAAARSCQRFRPIAQTSSHELSPTLSPCVLQIQAMSHAISVIPSTNKAYATGSSFANTESFFSMCSGRGLGRGRESTVLEAEGLLFEDCEEVEPGKGTSRMVYDEPGEKIVGRG
jgi:hypothetical protein